MTKQWQTSIICKL